MNTPNRYHLWAALECHAFSKAEAVLRFSAEEDGMWVQWQDYERLKAENERLRKAVKIADGAVDCVIQVHDYGFKVSTSYVESLKREWNAAKEGRPSV